MVLLVLFCTRSIKKAKGGEPRSEASVTAPVTLQVLPLSNRFELLLELLHQLHIIGIDMRKVDVLQLVSFSSED